MGLVPQIWIFCDIYWSDRLHICLSVCLSVLGRGGAPLWLPLCFSWGKQMMSDRLTVLFWCESGPQLCLKVKLYINECLCVQHYLPVCVLRGFFFFFFASKVNSFIHERLLLCTYNNGLPRINSGMIYTITFLTLCEINRCVGSWPHFGMFRQYVLK